MPSGLSQRSGREVLLTAVFDQRPGENGHVEQYAHEALHGLGANTSLITSNRRIHSDDARTDISRVIPDSRILSVEYGGVLLPGLSREYSEPCLPLARFRAGGTDMCWFRKSQRFLNHSSGQYRRSARSV